VVTTKSEAFDLFSKWLSENTKIHCDLSGHRYAMTMEGRITCLSGETLTLEGDDKVSEFVLRWMPDVRFEYADHPAQGSAHILIVLIPPFGDATHTQRVVFHAKE
jgi:hypothetical protein